MVLQEGRQVYDGETEVQYLNAVASKSVLERWCVFLASSLLAKIRCRAVLWVGLLGWGPEGQQLTGILSLSLYRTG